ncbi:N-acetylgalactosamine-6-sulfatase [Echinicola rosea]|uniref:N-acetylgalactosamine-6-sulfatase n=2 Tax=Echinicola rosea TaxID=1807691 RepID=A0ABQ1V569_9BACT|nr:N-acetylgalactosamine-6-sulfatase [Echinicola rosea]
MNMKPIALCLLLSLFATVVFAQKSDKQPNIIVVITDDQGKNDLGCEGNPIVKTPYIDQFYEESIRLTNFHVSTTCAPSRGALMTGRHTNRLNVYHTISGRSLLFEDEEILPQVLAQNGYVNGHFGKWHLGDNYPFRPMDRGFQEVVRHGGGGITQGPDYWGNDYFDDTYWHNGVLTEYEGYCTDVFFSEALRFIEENKDSPFFCYISTNAPHGPLNCPEDYLDMYKDVAGLSESHQRFYGMISNIDDNFKRLRDKLELLGLSENTILIFMSDNGTAGGNKVYDAGMSGAKGSVMEGGHRVPFYIKWPAKGIEGGKDVGQLTAHFDVLPTLVDLLDLNYTPSKKLDGKSLEPLMTDEKPEWPNRVLYVDTQRKVNLTKYKDYSVMDEKWRLVNGDALYDMDTDLKQTTNVIEHHPEVAERLALGYEKWWESIIAEKSDEKYAYIKVGTPYENPVRLMSHDILTGNLGLAWHQFGAIEPSPAAGVWKVEVMEKGTYQIKLRRFAEEADLPINATFPQAEDQRRIQKAPPASTKDDFSEAYLSLASFRETAAIPTNAKEVVFTTDLSPGKYDLEARLIDKAGKFYPAYYVYFEKIR